MFVLKIRRQRCWSRSTNLWLTGIDTSKSGKIGTLSLNFIYVTLRNPPATVRSARIFCPWSRCYLSLPFGVLREIIRKQTLQITLVVSGYISWLGAFFLHFAYYSSMYITSITSHLALRCSFHYPEISCPSEQCSKPLPGNPNYNLLQVPPPKEMLNKWLYQWTREVNIWRGGFRGSDLFIPHFSGHWKMESWWWLATIPT